MAATLDDIFILCQSLDAKVTSLQTDVNTIKTDASTIKTNLATMDDKIDLLSGDTTSTNVLDKVLEIVKKVKTIEFKAMKGK